MANEKPTEGAVLDAADGSRQRPARSGWRRFAWLLRYGLAAGAVAAALGLRLALEAWVGPGLPTYITFYPAVMAVALVAGFGPGLFATALVGLATAYAILPPEGFAIASPVDRLGLVVFIGMGLFMSVVAELYRRHRHKAAAYDGEAALRAGQEQLRATLAREQANLRTMFDAVNVGLLLIDDTGAVRRVNNTLSHWLGRDLSADLGHQPGDLTGCVHALSDAAGCGHTAHCLTCPIRSTFTTALSEGRPVHDVETLATLSIGGQDVNLWLEVSADPLVLDGCRHVILAMNNITARKKAEEALRLSEETFATAFADNPAAIAMTRFDDGVFLDVNDTWMAMNGYRREEVIGLSARELRIWPTAEAAARFVQELREKGSLRGWEQEFLMKSGQVFVAELSAKVLTVRGEEVILSTLVDITARKRSEQDLEKLNRNLKALSRSSQAMMRAEEEEAYLREVCRIVVEDCGHAMVWIGYAQNDADRSVRPVASAGFEAGYLETLKLTWADTERGHGPTGTAIRTGKVSACRNMLTDPRFAPWREEALKRGYASSIVMPLMADGRAFGAITIYGRQPDPFTDDEVALLTELAGDVAHGITSLRLRAERARAEEALRQTVEELARSNKDLEQFAYMASHDLQAPLRQVTGFMSLLRQRYAGKLDAKADEYIQFAVGGAAEMSRLISDLLAYSRAGNKDMALQSIKLREPVNRAMATLGESIAEAGAKITVADLPAVQAQSGQLAQVFQNLIGNAIKFRSERPLEINIGARRDDGCWLLWVKDNGIGLDPAQGDRAFEIFTRLHDRGKYPGTGIGLAICKKIVERHGGRIWMESKAGEGATFYFTIPEDAQQVTE